MKFKYWLRKILHRCIICNKKRENHKNCYHCLKYPLLCHNHGKITNFAEAYGMGKAKIIEAIGVPKGY